MINPKSWQRWHYLILLTGVWLSFLLLLVILQVAHSGWSLRMPLYAEDRLWYWHLLRPSIAGISSANSFWQPESRNPLSPVWYAVAGPFILSHPQYAFSLLRHSVDLLSAISIFLLIDTLGRSSHRLFAFSCALLALFWNSAGLNVSWNIIAVTALHVLSLWLYCLYVDSGRQKGRLLVLSVLIYFFANATYLLVAFSFVAVGILAIFRSLPKQRTLSAWGGHIFAAVIDTSFYAAALGLFYLLWNTMSGFLTGVSLNIRLISSQLPDSLRFMFIEPLSRTMPSFVSLNFLGERSGISIVLFFGSLVVFGLILWLIKHVNGSKNGAASSDGPAASLYSTIGYTLMVVFALIAYLVLLESLTSTWFPGARTFVVSQIVQPLTYISLFFAITHFLKRWLGKLVPWLQVGGVALICSLALLFSLAYQHIIIIRGESEQAFLDKLKLDISPSSLQDKPTEVLVLVTYEADPSEVIAAISNNGGSLQNYYMQTTYRRGDLGFHILTKGQMAPDSKPDLLNNQYIFGSDDKGVYMVSYLPAYLPAYNTYYTVTWVPYQNILFVKFDGENWTRVDQFTQQELAGYKVRFERDTPASSLYNAP